jgi:hypothetical protein
MFRFPASNQICVWTGNLTSGYAGHFGIGPQWTYEFCQGSATGRVGILHREYQKITTGYGGKSIAGFAVIELLPRDGQDPGSTRASDFIRAVF